MAGMSGSLNCMVLMQGTSVHPDFNDVSSLAGAQVPFKAL